MSYEATSRDMSESNYSSARQGANEDEATFAAEIELLTEIMSEIYETFVISCYLTGLINPPGFWDKKADYLAHKWVQAPKNGSTRPRKPPPPKLPWQRAKRHSRMSQPNRARTGKRSWTKWPRS